MLARNPEMNIFAGLLQAITSRPRLNRGRFFMIALAPHRLALTLDSPLFRVTLDNGNQSSNHIRVARLYAKLSSVAQTTRTNAAPPTEGAAFFFMISPD